MEELSRSIVEVYDLESSERGEMGFGSSDKINML